MNIVADTHTHTIASSHAYGTIIEMATYAAKHGLSCIAMTDHAPAMDDAAHVWHFFNLHLIPNYIEGVRVLTGAETNIIDYEGHIDLPEDLLKKMDWVVASFHPEAIKPGTVEQHTEAILGMLKNPYIDVFGHPGPNNFKFDYDYVVPKFKDSGKYIEFNASSFTFRAGAKENMRYVAKLCAKHGVEVVVNSDSHSPFNVGDVQIALDLLREVDFPPELIINTDLERFKRALLNRHIPVVY